MRQLLLLLCGLWLAHPALAGWKVAETAHFRVHSDGPESRLRAQAAMLEDYRGLLVMMTGREPPAAQLKLDIYLVNRIADANPFGTAPRLAVGYYKASDRQISAFAEDGDQARLVLLHEYAHHFMLGQSRIAHPAWYVEGFADYFANATFRPTAIEFGLGNRSLFGWLNNGPWIPLDRLLARGVRNRTPAEAAMFYAQSWLLTHYFFRMPGQREKLTAYLGATAQGADPVEAFRTHVDPDLKAFEARLRAYLKGRDLTFSRYARPPATPAAVSIRDHPPAADPMLLQLVALEHGVHPARQAQALAAVRKAAAAYPGDPLARRTLAVAELRLGDRAAAAALLDSLLEAEPTDADLLRWRAEGHVPDPRTASEESRLEARRLLVRAWKAHPGDWRVLHAWVRLFPVPLGDAQLEALLQARELAPQVTAVVMDSAIALAHAGRLEEAAFVLEPIAYSPHGGAISLIADRLMQEARAGNRQAFLSILGRPLPALLPDPADPAPLPEPPAVPAGGQPPEGAR